MLKGHFEIGEKGVTATTILTYVEEAIGQVVVQSKQRVAHVGDDKDSDSDTSGCEADLTGLILQRPTTAATTVGRKISQLST